MGRTRNLHQGATDGRCRYRHGCRGAPEFLMEQPGAGGGAGLLVHGRIVARRWQRRQPARCRGAVGAVAGKAKDNNASCAIGPFVRLFDATFTLDDIRTRRFRWGRRAGSVRLEGSSSIAKISRDPADLVAQMVTRITAFPTAPCCSSARCSRRSRTAMRRVGIYP